MNKVINLHHIAGYCPEAAIWKMIVDLCCIIQGQDKRRTPITPYSLFVDGGTFYIDDSDEISPEFLPPEYVTGESITESQQMWMLGATIYYASSGRILFGGHGGYYQRSNPYVQLPVLQKAHQAITPVMQRCLQTDPSQRINVQELKDIALRESERCRRAPRLRARPQQTASNKIITDRKWPEEMVEL